VLGKLSGRTAFRQRLGELGIELESEDRVNKAFQRFKDLADKKSEIFDEDLYALVSEEATPARTDERWRLVDMSQGSGTGERPHARVTLTEAGANARPRPRAMGRSTRRSRRSRSSRPAAPSCCCTR
jgi:2-isopropylmalate synthase